MLNTTMYIFSIQTIEPNLGGSNIVQTMTSMCHLYPANSTRSILLVSDGYLANTDMLMTVVQKVSVGNKLFCLGVG